jgi:Methyltransferase domain
MSWLAALRGAPRKEPAGGVGTATLEDAPEVHRSLALPAVFTALSRGHKLNVLDLGPATGGNVERLSEYGCKLFIEDLYASKASAEGASLDAEFFAQFFDPQAGTQFDVVLAWDLINYLDREELRHLASWLRQCCRPGALLFALVSIHKTIPAQPIRFRFHDGDKLVYERLTAVERPGPRFAPWDLKSAFKGFEVDRSFLLRHGIQEYLLIREGPAAQP